MTAAPSDEASFVFDESRVRTYDLTIDPYDLEAIDRRPSAEQTVPARLRFEGKTYRVGVRYKGSVGSFLKPCTAQTAAVRSNGPKIGKCSIKLEIDEYDPELRLYGLKTLNLHAMGRDASLMRERLGYGLFRQMGVASPRAVHARVVINGELEGLFLAVEQIDKRFARARFSDGGEGNLYKEVWPVHEGEDAYRRALETNEDYGDVDKMLAFKRAIDDGRDAAASFIDRSYMMKYMAVDRLILNDDGAMHFYCSSGNHNYYWYESSRADRLWLIPWDLDSSLDPSSRVHILWDWPEPADSCGCRGGQAGGSPQRPPSCDPLTAILGSYDRDYDAAVEQFVSGPFSRSRVDRQLNSWASQIEEYVDEAAGVQGAPDAYEWQQGVEELREIIDDARANRGYPYY